MTANDRATTHRTDRSRRRHRRRAARPRSPARSRIDGRPLNIFGVLGHHPKLLKRFNLLGGFILNKGLIPERERELVILRVGWNAQAVYEFGQHTVIGQRCGLTDDEIAALHEVAGRPRVERRRSGARSRWPTTSPPTTV